MQQQPPSTSRNNAALGVIGGSFIGVIALTSPFIFMQLRSPLPYMATPKHKIENALRFISQRVERTGSVLELTEGVKGGGSTAQHNNLIRQQAHDYKSNNTNNKLKFLDLGSGDGAAVFTAASLKWHATGMELNPTLWLISSLRRWQLPSETRKKCKLIYGDMFAEGKNSAKENMREANCIMIFGVAPLMPKIANLIQNNCQPGAFVMAYRFRVPLLSEGENERNKKEAMNKVELSKNINSSLSMKSGGALSSRRDGLNASLIYEEEEMRVYELNNDVTKSNAS